MWILHFIPDSWLYQAVIAIMGIGLTGFIGGFFLSFIPGIKFWGGVIKYISLAILVVGVYFFGSYSTEMTWRARAEAMQKKLDQASAKSKQKTALLQKKLNAQTLIIKQKAKDNANAIKKNADKIDADCKLTDTAIQLHNNAASDSEVSGTSKGTNGELPKSSTSNTDIKVK
jgi:hypothetical protein